MAKTLNLGCIKCEDRGEVTETKNGYRCGACGHVWQRTKPAGKSRSSLKEKLG